jgi:hypothetical protein
MKYFFSGLALLSVSLLFLISCESQTQKEERLAHQYCSSCHLFPEPSLLTKRSWDEGVLPQMGFRMGFPDMKIFSTFPQEDLDVILKSLPPSPMVTETEWEAIKNYYISNAPDSLASIPQQKYDSIKTFSVSELRFPMQGVTDVQAVSAK